ncbi:MAG: homoserine dehydrogenase [Thermoanaerobaculaceae bacterium]|jgi:predicted homoserine dehydrogenase-like protein
MSGTLGRLKALDREVRVAIVGAGAMGRGLFYQCCRTPGIRCVGIADIEIERAEACTAMMGRAYAAAGTARDVREALSRGAVAVCGDGMLLAECEGADVLIESSNCIGHAARFAIAALQSRKHLVLMNSEIDLIFGPYLAELAHRNGLVYTSCDGDQHGVLKHLVDDLTLWGFDLVMAGNMKGFLDRYANPTSIVPEADKRNLGYKMCTAYTDGTKLCIEMALLANALGLATPVPGMHGPRAAQVREVFGLLDIEALWRRHGPFVDYVLGAQPDGGVFAIGRCEHPYQQEMMAYYKMGKGPFYLFYRPYHLCHVEAMECVAEAALDGRSLLEPAAGFRANVFAYAKRDLRSGEVLDGIGGYTCYGMIDGCGAGGSHPGLPICLAENVPLTRGVPKDEPIMLDGVGLDPAGFECDLFLRALQASSRAGRP